MLTLRAFAIVYCLQFFEGLPNESSGFRVHAEAKVRCPHIQAHPNARVGLAAVLLTISEVAERLS